MKKIIGFCLFILAGCSNSTPQQAVEMPPVPVYAASIEVRDVPLFFEAIGTVKPAKTAEVKARVSGGIIEKIHFTEGEKIAEGALLYTLEETPYAIAVRAAEAGRDQTLVNLSRAKKKWERYKSLPNQDLIAKVEWDELESTVILQRAILKADEARIAAAKLDLERCKIRAPIAGFAGRITLHEGNVVGTDPLVTLMQMEPLSIDFCITEKELREMHGSAPIRIYGVGKEELLGEGRVTFMDHSIDPKSGMLSVRAVVAPQHQPLWPGQTVTVRVTYGKKEKAQLIPMRAIRTGQEGPYVFTITADNTVEMRTVKLGPEDNGLVVIESGVEDAAKIVTEGQHRLFPGSKIEVLTR